MGTDEELLTQFAPVIWLTNDEDNLPSSIEFYFDYADIYDPNDRIVNHGKKWTPPETLDDAKSLNIYSMKPPRGKQERLAKGAPLDLTGIVSPDVPIYAFARPSLCDDTKLWLAYVPFYPFNGNIFVQHLNAKSKAIIAALTLLGIPAWTLTAGTVTSWTVIAAYLGISTFLPVGVHWSDSEIIMIECDRLSCTSIERVYTSRHDDEGRWYSADDSDLTIEGDTVHIYAAYRSHAFYAETGIQERFFGFANDLTEKGIMWDTKSNVFNLDWKQYHSAFQNETSYQHYIDPTTQDSLLQQYKWMTYSGFMGKEDDQDSMYFLSSLPAGDIGQGINSPTFSSPWNGKGAKSYCSLNQKRNILQDSQSSLIFAGDSEDNIFGLQIESGIANDPVLSGLSQSEYQNNLFSYLSLGGVQTELLSSSSLIATTNSPTITIVVICSPPYLIVKWQRLFRDPSSEPWNVLQRNIPAANLTDLEITWNKDVGFCLLFVTKESGPTMYCWKYFEDFMFKPITISKGPGNAALVSCLGTNHLFWADSDQPGLQHYTFNPQGMSWNSPQLISTLSNIYFSSLLGVCDENLNLVKVYGTYNDTDETTLYIADLQIGTNNQVTVANYNSFVYTDLALTTILNVVYDSVLAPMPISGKKYWIQNIQSGLVIEASFSSDLYYLSMEELTYSDNQLFSFELIGDFYQIYLAANGTEKVLDVMSNGLATNIPIIVWPWHGADNQQWTLQNTQGAFLLLNKHSQKVITYVNNNIVQSIAVNTFEQMWRFVPY